MRSTKVMTLTLESIEHYRNWCIGRGQSENTAKAYSTDLRMLLLHFRLEEISPDSFEMMSMMWLNQTRKDSSPKTTGRRLTSLRSFARWANIETEELNEYKAPVPGKQLPHPIPEGLIGLQKMESACMNPEQQALVGACGYIGLRVSEALSFKTSWLYPREMLLRVRGKGDKERIVPVSPRAWSAIQTAYVRAMQSDGYLIHYPDRSARKSITSIGRRAGLSRHISSHDLRATYATIMSDQGVPIRVIQELLGHSSLNTTEIYTGVGVDAMKAAVNF